jgi:hypothetical protein
VLVSDGILEARDARGNEYGVKRLSRRLRTARGSAEDVVKSILQDVDSHIGNAPPGDDMTVLAMGIDERRAKRRTSTIPGVPVDAVQGQADDSKTRPGVGIPRAPTGDGSGDGR